MTFIGEPGLDLGGLTKEWFLLLIRNLFRPEYGMFVYSKVAGTYWFNLQNKDKKLKEYNLIGVVSSSFTKLNQLFVFSTYWFVNLVLFLSVTNKLSNNPELLIFLDVK